MTPGSRAMAGDMAALLLVAVACPAALFGGAMLGCAAQGLTTSCAMTGILISPPLLVGAGAVAGILTRGWPGLGFVTFGVFLGMLGIPIVASAAGNPVPIDPAQGVIAMIWFLPPVALGYGIARGVARLVARSRSPGG